MLEKHTILTKRLLDTFTQIREQQYYRLKELNGLEDIPLKCKTISSGKRYYSAKLRDADNRVYYKYIGNDSSQEVNLIKEAHYIKKSLELLGKNIDLLQPLLNGLTEIDSDTVNKNLPKLYRNAAIGISSAQNQRAVAWKSQSEAYKATFKPYRPEELIHKTDDGTMVRSKSEAIIYNLLLHLGVTFVYELPTRTNVKTFFPDFTILSEVDYKTTIIIEHQGMMDNEAYRDHFRDRVYDYLCAGYVQGLNIFYTFDHAGGGIDTDPIIDIIKTKIRPDR